jgi:hypothetical protein
MFKEQSPDGVHALPATTDDPPLTTRRPTGRTLWFASLVYKRGVEAADASGDDASASLAGFDDPPSARRNAKVNSEDTPDRTFTHHATRKSTHNRKLIIDRLLQFGNHAVGNRSESHGKRRKLRFSLRRITPVAET